MLICFKQVLTSVIVVDDDFDTVEVFSEFLILHDIDVLGTATNGLDGINLFKEKHPDIVFSDIWMPEYDGLFLLKNLKAIHPNCKIVMVTADLTYDTDKKLQELKADSIIYKPFKIDQIMETIEKLTRTNNDLLEIGYK